jgi:hypothetical protein
VFVDIRERIEQPEAVIGGANGVVRLHTLDECVRLYGNSRKSFEYTVRERRRLSRLQGITPNWESAILLPISGESDLAPIQIDEIESDVIQGGPQLIDKFPGVQRDEGGRLKHVDCFFAIRFDSETITIAGNILGDGILQSFEVFDSSLEFHPNR